MNYGGPTFPQWSKRARANSDRMRKRMNQPEWRLWRAFHENDMHREMWHQWPAGPYILDFFFPRFSLAVEVDGKWHLEAEQRSKDAVRDFVVGNMGIETLRIEARIVLGDLDMAIAIVQGRLAEKWPENPRPIHY